jgi:hypothetical protein
VRYTLKTPYPDGTTQVVFTPLDFIARLAALVPKPRVHLTRYHGVFAPHSAWRYLSYRRYTAAIHDAEAQTLIASRSMYGRSSARTDFSVTKSILR